MVKKVVERGGCDGSFDIKVENQELLSKLTGRCQLQSPR